MSYNAGPGEGAVRKGADSSSEIVVGGPERDVVIY